MNNMLVVFCGGGISQGPPFPPKNESLVAIVTQTSVHAVVDLYSSSVVSQLH